MDDMRLSDEEIKDVRHFAQLYPAIDVHVGLHGARGGKGETKK